MKLLTETKEVLCSYINNLPERKYIKRIDIYKNDLLFVDFEFKGVKFFFDLKPFNDGSFSLKFGLRSGSRIIDGIDGKDEIIISSLEGVVEPLKNVITLIDQSMIDFTIIVPVFNRAELIVPCVNSLNKLDYDKNKFEIIFIDDNSKDGSVDVIKSLINSNLNYSIIERKANSGGASAPRNDGIRLAKGEYIFFCDSDDEVSVDLLSKAKDFIYKNNSDLLYVKIGAKNRSAPKRTFKYGSVDQANVSLHHLLRSNGPYKFYRKSILVANNIFFSPDLRLAEDKLFNFQFILNANVVSILADKEYYFLNAHDGDHLSQTKTDFNFWCLLYSRMLCDLYQKNIDESKAKSLYNALLIMILEVYKKFFFKDTKTSINLYKNYEFLYDLLNLRKNWLDPNLIYSDLHGYLVCFFRMNGSSFGLNSTE